MMIYIKLFYQKENPIFDMFGTNVPIFYDIVDNVILVVRGKTIIFWYSSIHIWSHMLYLTDPQ